MECLAKWCVRLRYEKYSTMLMPAFFLFACIYLPLILSSIFITVCFTWFLIALRYVTVSVGEGGFDEF